MALAAADRLVPDELKELRERELLTTAATRQQVHVRFTTVVCTRAHTHKDFISKLGKLNNDVMKVCYNNFWRSDEGVRLQCEFDIAAGVSAEDTKDIVFSKFYAIAITAKQNVFLSFSVSQYFIFSILYNILCTYLSLHAH